MALPAERFTARHHVFAVSVLHIAAGRFTMREAHGVQKLVYNQIAEVGPSFQTKRRTDRGVARQMAVAHDAKVLRAVNGGGYGLRRAFCGV